MKRKTLSVIFLFLIFMPINSFALPLPTSVVKEFSGYAYCYGNRTDLSGVIQFELIKQTEYDWTTLDLVEWSFVAKDYSGNLLLSGNFSNGWAFAHPDLPKDLTEAPWDKRYWEGMVYSHLDETVIDSQPAQINFNDNHPSVDPLCWFFGDNSNFLPEELFCVSPNGYLDLQIVPQPVPEPNSLAFITFGLICIVAKKNLKKIMFYKNDL